MSIRKHYDYKGRANQGAWLELPEANARIKLLGQDSDTWRRTSDAYQLKVMRQRRKTGEMPEVTPEESRRINNEAMAAQTVAWETKVDGEWQPWLEIDEGERVPCTTENALRLYEEFPSIYDLADTFTSDRKNYPGQPEIQPAPRSLIERDGEVEKNSSPGPSGDTAQTVEAGAQSAAA